MRFRLLSRAVLGPASLSVCILGLLAGASGAWAAGLSASSLESPGVRQAIARQLQVPGPSVVTQGGSGGSAEPAAPAGGELVPSLSSAYSNTWRVLDHPMVSRIYAAPVNYKGTDDVWHQISNQLVPSALGGYENEANGFSLQIPMSLSSGVSLTSAGRSVSFALEGAREALPSVSGSRATYPEALTSTDFEYLSSSTGVQETATLKNQSAPSELRFVLSASPGLQALKDPDGAIQLADSQGKVWFRIPAPLAHPQSAGPASGQPLPTTLTPSGSGWVLAIDTGESWLRSDLASGLVAVDPTIEESGSQNCTIESYMTKTSACTQETFAVGYHSEAPAHEHHGLLQFNLSSLPTDIGVEYAKLGLYLASESTTNSKAVGVYRVTRAWTTSATWETYDGTHAWTTPGGDYANPSENSDASVNPSVGGSTGWQYWYPTKMVQEWANGANAPEKEGYENDGLIVKDEKDNTVNNTLEFDSIHASAHQPFLEVAYEPHGVGSQPQFTILNTQLTGQMSMGVNVASGDLLLQSNALHIAGRGIDFSSELEYNNFDPEVHDYGRWTDSGDVQLYEQPDGSVEFENGGAYFVFLKQANGTYVTPAGIKAVLCTAGNLPCPGTLPAGVKWRLIYNQSQEHIDFNEWGRVLDDSDRYGNTLTAGYTEGINQITSWTDTQGRKIEYFRGSSNRSFTEVKDVAGGRHVSYEYEGSGAGQVLIAYTDANGGTTHYHYEYSDLNKITTPKGNVIKLTYDGQHRIHYITRTTNSEHTTGPTTKFTYYAAGSAPAPCTSKQKATVVTDPDSVAGESAAPVYSSQFGSTGSGAGQLIVPKGIVLDGKGDVMVADEGNFRVDVFKENGEFVKSFGSYGSKAGQFVEVKGVAVDSKGNIWAVDQGNDWVEEFNEKGEYIKTVGSAGSGTGQLKEPKGIAIDAHNNVWITDFGNNRVEEFNEKGEFVRTVGSSGSGNGQFAGPRELAVDRSGYVWVTDAGNNRVEEFNEKGEFLKTFGSLGTGNGQFKEPKGITVDAQNNVWVTDAENNRIEKFNGAGEYETQFGSEGTEHGQFHEPWGIQVNAHGEVFVSDTNNNRIEKFAPAAGSEAGHTETYCANVLDEVEKTVDASGNATEASYNSFGNVTSTTASAPGNGESGNVESLGYDKAGINLECVVTGTSKLESSCPSSPNKSLLVTSFSYKDEKNPFSATQVQNPESNSVFSCYNEGHQEGSKGPACPTTATGPAGSLQNKNDQLATEHELKFSYNSNGTISASTDADGHTTGYEYDTNGNLKKITPPTGSTLGSTTIAVDADSRPHVVTDGAGHIETITYDKLDRITEIAYTGTGTAKTVKYEYDADGNITMREDPTGTTKYTVDPVNRVTKEELPGSLSNSYEYDAASNMTTFTDGGGTTKYKYNGLNELESMLEPGETKETTFAYDNDHRLNKITYASGAKEVYKLEPTTGRPETITTEGVTGTTVPKLTYAYKEGENDASLVQKLTESTGNTSTYSYDQLNRLKSAVTTGTNPSLYEFKLDGAGNRTQQTVNPTGSTGGTNTYYVANSGNLLECRQTVAPPCSKNSSTELSAYTFDGAGNETAITPKSDTSGTTFAFNAASELSSLTPSGSGAQALSYGGTGQDDLTALGSTTTLQNSQLGLTREVTSAGTSYYARTPNGLLIDQRTPSGHYNPLRDAQGDIIALVNSSAKVERTFRYGPYGENTKSEGTQTIPYPFGFKSGYRMPGGNKGEGNVTNALYHYGQRYYDPTTGRWTQQDLTERLGSPTQSNRFTFVGGDPINLSDPSGQNAIASGAIAAGSCGAVVATGGWAAVAAGAVCAGSTWNFLEEAEEEWF